VRVEVLYKYPQLSLCRSSFQHTIITFAFLHIPSYYFHAIFTTLFSYLPNINSTQSINMFRTLVSLAALTSVFACPEHDFNIRARDDLGRRATAGAHDWDYKDPSSWGSIKAGMSPQVHLPRTSLMIARICNLLHRNHAITHQPCGRVLLNHPQACPRLLRRGLWETHQLGLRTLFRG